MTKRFTLIFVIGIVSSLVFIPSSYAMHESETVSWQLVFISADHGCGNYHYQMMNKYNEITAKYFELYKFPNSSHSPICIPNSQYSKYKTPDDLDLLILVYDYEIGRKELNQYDVGGFYEHVGNDRTKNHIIAICDCSNFRFSDPVWLLSHELSHFILYYDGLSRPIAEDWVHEIGAKYDYCTTVKYAPACKAIETTIHGTNYFSTATVMTPYAPAVGITFIPQVNETISPQTLRIDHAITQWWLEGKISDSDYYKVLSLTVGQTQQYSSLPPRDPFFDDSSSVLIADGPYFEDEKKVENVTSWSSEKTSTVFAKVPFKQEANGTISDAISWHFPQWFKSRAYWWSNGEYWNDTEFISSAKYLFGN